MIMHRMNIEFIGLMRGNIVKHNITCKKYKYFIILVYVCVFFLNSSDSIHSIRYDGTDLREILRDHQFISHPFAISVFGNYMYWTDWRSNSVLRVRMK